MPMVLLAFGLGILNVCLGFAKLCQLYASYCLCKHIRESHRMRVASPPVSYTVGDLIFHPICDDELEMLNSAQVS